MPRCVAMGGSETDSLDDLIVRAIGDTGSAFLSFERDVHVLGLQVSVTSPTCAVAVCWTGCWNLLGGPSQCGGATAQVKGIR